MNVTNWELWPFIASIGDAMKAVLQRTAEFSVAVLLGGVAGGFLGSLIFLFTWGTDRRATTLREFLRHGLEVCKLREAYLLSGDQASSVVLADHPDLPTKPSKERPSDLWLRQVEVRAVLDQPAWNTPSQPLYGFLDGRRAWIVRNEARSELSYGESLGLPIQPALLSSQAIEEICGWIEEVAAARPRWLLLGHASRKALRPLLIPLTGEDRISVLHGRLTPIRK
jgi:hypothetical protein